MHSVIKQYSSAIQDAGLPGMLSLNVFVSFNKYWAVSLNRTENDIFCMSQICKQTLPVFATLVFCKTSLQFNCSIALNVLYCYFRNLSIRHKTLAWHHCQLLERHCLPYNLWPRKSPQHVFFNLHVAVFAVISIYNLILTITRMARFWYSLSNFE